MSGTPLIGGCQCGAVRFRAERLGRASICHCRMCQKAFGAFYGPLVSGVGVMWTRGEPKRFRSSNKVRRGFCVECGTPLTYEYDGGIELAIGALDDPALAAPVVQVNGERRLPFVDGLGRLPLRGAGEDPKLAAFFADIVSHQHPDHDTAVWPVENESQTR